MKKNSKVSIIIRTKNEERWISNCLDKIFNQNYKNFEVILADNCSTDKTVIKAKKYPIKLIKIKNFLPGRAINDAIKISSGEIIVCLSAHCIPVDNHWLKRLVHPLKDKKIAGVYGRQEPLPYSSDFDKRDLLLLFGLDKKIQSKDPFFHNANSAFLKKVWKKNQFDEKTTNIEDRIWGSQVINQGYKIIYEPKASVFHFHGVHQNLNPERCASVVNIMEKTMQKNYLSFDDLKNYPSKQMKIIAILPIRGKPIKYKNKFLMEFTIKKILQDELVDDIYISTDDNETAKVGKSFGAKCPFIRPKNLANKSTDLISVAKHTLKKIEEKNIFPDLIYIVTEDYPLREKDLLKMMLTKLKKNGLETIVASKKEKSGVWLRNIANNKFNKIVDNTIPGDLRENETFIAPFGLGCLMYSHNLRAGNFFNENYGLYTIKNIFSSLAVKSEKSLKDLAKLKDEIDL